MLFPFPDVNQCFQNNPCSGNGQCLPSSGANGSHCICDARFAGNICQCKRDDLILQKTNFLTTA